MSIKVRQLSYVASSDIPGFDDDVVRDIVSESNVSFGDTLNAHTLIEPQDILDLLSQKCFQSEIDPDVLQKVSDALRGIASGTLIDLET